MNFKSLQCEWLNENTIFHLKLNRPNKLNAMDGNFIDEMQILFKQLNDSPTLRCVILTANGKAFCAGLDLQYAQQQLFQGEEIDSARKAIKFINFLKIFQNSISVLEECRVPVLAGVHGLCIGGGIDLITSADIRLYLTLNYYRYCTIDAKFSIKEIDIGMAADIGTLQRTPLKCGNDSLFRELVYTGRFFDSQEAKTLGLVSNIKQNFDDMLKAMLADALTIAGKSPVGIWANKRVLTNDFKLRYSNNLDYVGALNSALTQTSDITEAIGATLSKQKPIFPKL